MKKYFEGIGDVVFEKLPRDRIEEAVELIHAVYQHEGIWSTYTKEQVREEITASFVNMVYNPVFFIALLNSKIIGIASYMDAHISSEAFEVSFATVLPEYHGKGLGTWLMYIRLKEIIEREKNALILTRTRKPSLFEKFNFKYIHKTIDADGSVGAYDYMYGLAHEIDFTHLALQ